MTSKYIYIYIYIYIRVAFSIELRLTVSRLLRSLANYCKRALKMIFKGSGCFQFPEAVVTSTAKESLRSTERGSLEVLAVL